MELKEFIKAAISDITGAISELQGELNNGTIVNPSIPYAISTKTIKHDGMNRVVSQIDFDVAITVGDSNKCEGGAGVGIQIFSAKMGGGKEKHTENVSRMTFSIPVIFPTEKIETPQEIAEKKYKPTSPRSNNNPSTLSQ